MMLSFINDCFYSNISGSYMYSYFGNNCPPCICSQGKSFNKLKLTTDGFIIYGFVCFEFTTCFFNHLCARPDCLSCMFRTL